MVLTTDIPLNTPAGVTIQVERTIKNADGTVLLCTKYKWKFSR